MRLPCLFWVWLALAAQPLTAVEFHVAPAGLDAAEGTAQQPFASWERARTAVRDLLSRGAAEPITVWLHAGTHVRTHSFVLDASDSGTASAPVIWRAPADRSARIVLSRAIAPSAALVVDDAATLARLDPSARGHVVRIDLAAVGARPIAPLAKVFTGAGGLPQVVFADRPLPLARWPDDSYSTMERVLSGGGTAAPGKPGGVFAYRGDRPARWIDAAKRGDLWVAGFWRVPWVVQAVQVQAVDASARTIALNAPVSGGIGSKYSKEVDGTRQGDGKEPWYALNLLEELDRPGEWCVDIATQTLYLWPPAALVPGTLRIDDQPEPVIRLNGASNIQLRDLVVSGGLAEGIRVDGGQDVLIAGCLVQDVGGAGIRIVDGRHHVVRSCDLVGCGAEGITMSAGQRATLTGGRCEVLNNHVHHYGRVTPMVSGIVIDGVGTHVANNLLHDAPYGGVLYHGNDHLMELNEVHNIGLDGGDLGAFYTNGDWASRGNVMRHNLVHHARNANGFYMDDGHSGDVIELNLVFEAACGPFIGGGHHHQVRDNLVIACAKGIHLDDRGVARNYDRSANHLMKPLEKLPWQNEPWTTRYPELAAMFAEDRLPLPTGNRIAGNVLVACAKPMDLSGRKESLAHLLIGDNALVTTVPDFSDANRIDFRLRHDAPAVASVLARIPCDRIGLRIDEDRRALPDATITGRYEHRPGRRLFDSATDVKRTDEERRR